MRISIDPESLRGLSRQLQQSGEQIRQMTAVLNQALGSLTWDTSKKEALLNEWQIANRQGEQIAAILNEMGANLQTKVDQFQQVDQQNGSFRQSSVPFYGSAVSMYSVTSSNEFSILGQEYGQTQKLISDPSSAISAMAALFGEPANQASGGAIDSAEWIGLDGTVMTGEVHRNTSAHTTDSSFTALNQQDPKEILERAAIRPQSWTFYDPIAKSPTIANT